MALIAVLNEVIIARPFAGIIRRKKAIPYRPPGERDRKKRPVETIQEKNPLEPDKARQKVTSRTT